MVNLKGKMRQIHLGWDSAGGAHSAGFNNHDKVDEIFGSEIFGLVFAFAFSG